MRYRAPMRFAEDKLTDSNVIRGYEDGQITVNEACIDRHVVITAQRLIPDWAPDFETLAQEHFDRLHELEPEILILGTGKTLRFPNPAYTTPFLQAGVGVEVMDTAAACRTYNILLSEGRRVVAALFMM